MRELTNERYIEIGAQVSEADTLLGKGHIAYAASYPHAVAEALAEPSEQECHGVGRGDGPYEATKRLLRNRLARLTAKPDPLRKALSRWVSDGDMDEAIAAVDAERMAEHERIYGKRTEGQP